MPRPSWDLIRLLLVVHRAGTFEGAAQALKIDGSTLRRKLHLLESQLGMSLLARSEGRIVIAPEHEDLLRNAVAMEHAFEGLLQGCASAGRGGTLRVSTLDILADIMVAGLGSFRRDHPDIRIELTTEPHFVDLERDRIDVAIRLARPLRGSEGLRRIATLPFAVYASAEYLAGHSRGPHDLLSLYTHYNRVDHDFELADEQWNLDPSLAGSVVARADNYPTLLRMCEGGLGLAMLPAALAERRPGLRRVPSADRVTEIGVWALIRRDASKLPKTQAFLSFVTSAFARLNVRPVPAAARLAVGA